MTTVRLSLADVSGGAVRVIQIGPSGLCGMKPRTRSLRGSASTEQNVTLLFRDMIVVVMIVDRRIVIIAKKSPAYVVVKQRKHLAVSA